MPWPEKVKVAPRASRYKFFIKFLHNSSASECFYIKLYRFCFSSPSGQKFPLAQDITNANIKHSCRKFSMPDKCDRTHVLHRQMCAVGSSKWTHP